MTTYRNTEPQSLTQEIESLVAKLDELDNASINTLDRLVRAVYGLSLREYLNTRARASDDYRRGLEDAAKIAKAREKEGGEYALAAAHIAAAIRELGETK